MFSEGMFCAFASAMIVRSRGFMSGSPPPARAATVNSLMRRVNTLPRFASAAPFLCLIVAHLECPDMVETPAKSTRSDWKSYHMATHVVVRTFRLLALAAVRTASADRRSLAARGESPASHRGRRGAPLARRDDREYREYLREEQRRQRGCIAGRMPVDFHHGLLGAGGFNPFCRAGLNACTTSGLVTSASPE